MRYLLISLLTLFCFAGSQDVSMKTLELTLLVQAEPEILFNHVNPVQFTLSSPYSSRMVEATGQPYADNPDIYFQVLEPVTWTLELPTTSVNKLNISIIAELALCDEPKGICYLQDVRLEETVDISQQRNKQTLTVNLSRPQY
jgi:hypothetical protein